MVTRDNYEELLDAGMLLYDSGAILSQLWKLERRALTRRQVRLPGAFVTPVYFGEKGVHGAGSITEMCFWADGRARSMLVRAASQEMEVQEMEVNETHSYAA